MSTSTTGSVLISSQVWLFSSYPSLANSLATADTALFQFGDAKSISIGGGGAGL
jgi:hypothetical protein